MAEKMENESTNTFERYRELMQRRAQLEEMLGKAEADKSSVKQDIYDRVCREYQSTLDEVSRDLNPLQTEIEESRKKWSTELEDIESKEKEVEEKLEEAKFRCRVGEYDESRYSGLETPLKKELEELSGTRSKLSNKLDEIETLTNNTSFDETTPTELASNNGGEHERSESLDAGEHEQSESLDAGEHEQSEPLDAGDPVKSSTQPNEQPTWLPEAANETDKEPVAEESRAYESDEVIDLTEWAREFQNENADRRRKTDTSRDEPAIATEDGDTLPDLADPSVQPSEDDQTTDDSHRDSEDTPIGFPILIITKGPGAGKKLPLVPMTMTLGREHDNNIELKDEDVARYHARISYKSGSYLLEDLESSSGTWLNDEKIVEATLQHGDKLRLGATEMMVDFE